VAKLKSRQSFGERYVKAHWTKLVKWKPLGEGDRGY